MYFRTDQFNLKSFYRDTPVTTGVLPRINTEVISETSKLMFKVLLIVRNTHDNSGQPALL